MVDCVKFQFVSQSSLLTVQNLLFVSHTVRAHEGDPKNLGDAWALPIGTGAWLKVKVKVHTLDIAPLRSESPKQKRSGMARVLKDFTVLPAHPHVHPQSE